MTTIPVIASQNAIYINGRFGFQIAYPAVALHESESGDGAHAFFGCAHLSVCGGNTHGASLSEEYARRIQRRGERKIISQSQGEDYFEMSWIDQTANESGYSKVFMGVGSRNEMTFVYPANEKEKYESILHIIASSFRPGDLSQCW